MAVNLAPSTDAPHTAWRSLHVFLYWRPEHVDAFLSGTVAPLMNGLREAGHLTDWFFIRYFENGPHLRIRARDADAATLRKLREALVEAVRSSSYPMRSLPERGPAWRQHGEVCEIDYEPETERYGGHEALPVAEDVFCRSSQIAIAVVGRTVGPEQRLVAAADLVLATAVALDLDRLDTVRWLRWAAIAWRWYRDNTTLAPPMVQDAALNVAADQSAALARRWADIAASASDGQRLRDRWAQQIKAARVRLESGSEVSRERWLQVWSSQLHMLLNRIGVLPDEERALYWFITASLLAPQGATDFFADHTDAVDRRYLDASKFVWSRIEWQQPRSVRVARSRPRLSAKPPVALPSGAPIATPLSTALADRISRRGDLGGSVSAAELGTLLWSAYGGSATPDAVGRPRRPYPSAGAKYVAQLRLMAWAVDGLAPGQYEVDHATRTLLPICPAPTVNEVVAASMWFSLKPPAAADVYERVNLSTLPALLGLYVDLGALRKSYGLRALRFGLLEAGHLAQNLALCAAATGLSLGMLGGFYDDVAHELFLLDGVDEVLAYLLPVGRHQTRLP